MKKTRWFNLCEQSPVRSGFYERRCSAVPTTYSAGRRYWIGRGQGFFCMGCQWRGLAKKHD